MTQNLNTIAKMIEDSFENIRPRKAVRTIQDMDLIAVSYKTLVVLEDAFGKTKPEQNRRRYRYWYALKPMTNLACTIGTMICDLEMDTDVEERNHIRFKRGYHILNTLVNNGLLEFVREGENGSYKARVAKGAEDTMEDLMSDVDSPEIDIPVYTRPQYKKPIPFTRFYHPEAGSLVRNVNPEVVKSFDIEECPKVYEVINKHMSIPYEINRDLLDIYKASMDDDIFTFADQDVDEEQLEGLERERDKVLEIATSVGDRTFWEYMFYDYRNRLYPSTAYLSHAGCKLSKSLFLYKEKKELTMEGYFWLLVHCANTWGEDDGLIDARYDFADANLDEWIVWAKDPINNKGWQNADSPYEFLAAIKEVANSHAWVGGPYSYPSGLAVAWDATCSGLQVLSALAKDEKSGKLCNLTDTEEKGDYYLMIADEVWKDCTYTEEEEKAFEKISKELDRIDKKVASAFKSRNSKRITESLEERKAFNAEFKQEIYAASKVYWGRPEMKKLRRKVAKRPCMTYFYSCGAQTMSKAMYSDHSADKAFKGLNSYFCFWLAKRIYKACQDLMPIPTALMDLFIQMGVDDYNNGQDFSIRAPYTGFTLMQYYRTDKTRRVEVSYKNKTIKPRITIDKNAKINRNKVLSATSPNIVHMLDSQVVAGVVSFAEYTVSSIHDSFATHAADAGKLFEDTRDVFIALFQDDVLAGLIAQKSEPNYADVIQYGRLNVAEASNNEYCFS